MTFRIAAPFPGLETTTYLPNPALSDVQRKKNQVQERRAIDGTLRTYLKSSSSFQFDYTFNLTKEKSIELLEFIRSYFRATWLITDHDGITYVVALTNNPWQFIADRAAKPVTEIVGIPLSFEGTAII
jgi:hypothetical protein